MSTKKRFTIKWHDGSLKFSYAYSRSQAYWQIRHREYKR